MHTGEEVALEDAEFFRALTAAQLERVRPLLIEKRIVRGRVLFFDGIPAEYLWAIRRGQIRLYKSSPEGRITTLELIGSGEIFGAVSSIEQENYSAGAEGVSEGIAWCLPRAVFLRMLEDDPSLALEILRVVSRRLMDAQERVRSFANDSAPSRLAQALLRVARDGEARVTRKALAESAGTTVETAIRVLRGFERDEIVRSTVGHVSVLDELALREIASPSRPSRC